MTHETLFERIAHLPWLEQARIIKRAMREDRTIVYSRGFIGWAAKHINKLLALPRDMEI